MSLEKVRKSIVEACRWLEDEGLVAGASGNVSVRLPDDDGKQLIAITPSRVAYRDLKPAQVLVIDFERNVVDGEGSPSSETVSHLAAYRARDNVGSVIHSHSIYASALALAGQEIPCVLDEQVVAIGGPVRCAGYAMSATEDLARNAVETMGERQAVLLRNHGVLAVGRDLPEVLSVVQLVERLAHSYLLARLIGEVHPLPDNVVAIEEKFYRIMHGFPHD